MTAARSQLRLGRLDSGNAAITTLAAQVWLLDPGVSKYQLKAYRDHYKWSKGLIVDDRVLISRASVVAALIAELRAVINDPIKDIRNVLKSSKTGYLKANASDASVAAVLRFAVRLWLFIGDENDHLTSDDLTLNDVVKRSLPPYVMRNPISGGIISEDFCEKSLTRRAGLKIVWTSDLSEHLEMIGKNKFKVFRHATALSQYAGAVDVEGNIFPPGFLSETEQTIALLFPEIESRDSRRKQRIVEKNCVDIEAGPLIEGPSRNLKDYPYWGERLRQVQKVYNEARPNGLKQWYFDRRNKDSWSTFWLTFFGFSLALIFGIISSVTSIMAVIIALRQNR